jgi:hypothetical protein
MFLTLSGERVTMTEIWIALILTWALSVERVVDKEFGTEKECWDYYEVEIAPGTTVAEGKWGKQNLDHQGRRPDKIFHFKTNWNYPIRTYKGLGESPSGKDQVWLSCERKYPNIYNE